MKMHDETVWRWSRAGHYVWDRRALDPTGANPLYGGPDQAVSSPQELTLYGPGIPWDTHALVVLVNAVGEIPGAPPQNQPGFTQRVYWQQKLEERFVQDLADPVRVPGTAHAPSNTVGGRQHYPALGTITTPNGTKLYTPDGEFPGLPPATALLQGNGANHYRTYTPLTWTDGHGPYSYPDLHVDGPTLTTLTDHAEPGWGFFTPDGSHTPVTPDALINNRAAPPNTRTKGPITTYVGAQPPNYGPILDLAAPMLPNHGNLGSIELWALHEVTVSYPGPADSSSGGTRPLTGVLKTGTVDHRVNFHPRNGI